MSITTLTSREFNQDTSRAKKAARSGPVFITDRGQPAHVLLSIEDYYALAGQQANVADLLSMPETDVEIDFDPPRLQGLLARPADLG
jgi:prevent-host-death family protein